MAGARKTADQKSLAKLKEEIGELLANENGRIDGGIFKQKYKEYFGKDFKTPKGVSSKKLTDFLQKHMSDVVEISREGTANFIVAKSKRKETVTVKQSTCISKDAKQRVSALTPETFTDFPPLGSEPLWPNHLTVPSSFPGTQIRQQRDLILTPPAPTVAASPLMRSKPLRPNHQTTPSSSAGTHIRQQLNTGPQQSNVKIVNDTVKKIIDELAEEHFVDVELVKNKLFQQCKIKRLRDLGLRDNDVPALKDLIRKQREIHVAIQAFVTMRSVSTLKELSQYLTNLYEGAREFEDIKIGPLVKHPLIYEYFKFPSNLEPPNINTLKVLKYLKQFMNTRDKWRDKVDLKEFLDYLVEQTNCTEPYQLGVKIESVALMIKSIKRCCSDESRIRREAEKTFTDELAAGIEEHLKRSKRRLLGDNKGFDDALVNQLIDLSPVDILKKLFEYCMEFFKGKVKKNVEAFIKTCLTERLCRKLFQLALHKTCRELVEPVEDQSSHVGYIDNEVSYNELSAEEQAAMQSSLPALDDLFHEVKCWLVKLSSASMNTRLLASVEQHILDRYKFQAFRDLGHGTFLKFLSEHKDLEKLISLPGHSSEISLGTANKSDILAMIEQCGADSDRDKILKSIRAQYRLDPSFNSTPFDVLIEKSRHQSRDSNLAPQKIVYEACLVSESLVTFENETDTGRGATKKNGRVGLLGYQDESKVLQCLYQTPLLEDFASWSNWDNVFAPSYGDLKTFLRKVKQTRREDTSACYPDDLVAMETASGSLLRITRCTSVQKFSESANDADVTGTCGHLVSLVLHHGGVEKAPLALLANKMKETLLFLSSSLESSTVDDTNEFIVRFAIRCLKRIPSLMRVALAMQIFIEPLKHVLGNVATPGLVLKHCETNEEKSMVHGLGIRLGITEWQEDFQKKLVRCTSMEAGMLNERKDARIVKEHRESLKKHSKTQNNDKESAESGHDQTNADKILTNVEEEKRKENVSDETEVSLESDNSELLDEKKQRCRDVIESIRRDEFGIGVELPPEHLQMIQKQRSREGRGLHRLSSELYSKDTHFVLELVQNADDNCYPEQSTSSDPPSIAFTVNNDKVVILNNEVGFQEKNIRALCDVGQSTKGKQRYGYIGQKGIGFKSVFRITDTPEVHSNGYHIKFDAKSGPTGYILPHWCEPADEDSSTWNPSWATRIVLTLKDEMKKNQKTTLIARFHDIQPSLLLFLRRLRVIKIVDEVSNRSREMVRRDLGDNLIELKHSSGVDLWFVVKKELPASSLKPEIETTEIALAFPVPAINSKSCISLDDIASQIHGKSFVEQPVFAFLPLRSYGFRFIVQADFDVPSSREDVDKDSAWNQWLRQEISCLFVEAFDKFKDHPYFDGVSSIVQFLQFIPLENEILDFFKPVKIAILDGIHRKPCVPCRDKISPNADSLPLTPNASVQNSEQLTDHDADNLEEDDVSGDTLKWVFPSQAVVAEDPEIEKLVSVEDLSRYLGKSYVHSDVQSYLNPALRRVLGIETLSCRHLIDIGKAISGENLVKYSLEDFSRWVAKWLCCVYRCLERERDCSDETLHKIASLSLYPLSNGEYTKLSGQAVFLPLEETVKGEQIASKASKKAAEIIHKDLRSLHPMLLTSLDDIGRSQARKLLEQLQVKCVTSRDLIKHHIIPSLKENQKQIVKSPEVLCSFIIYIKEQWDTDPKICDLEELRTCTLLKTNDGFVNPVIQPVHFTVEYGNETNLKKDFPSVPWTLLDNTYLAGSRNSQSSWERFFSSLGVVHFIAIERKDVCLSKSELTSSIWSAVSEFWPQVTGDGRYTIKDYVSNELEKLLSPDSSEKELIKLAEILDQKWDDKYAKYANIVPYMDTQGKVTGHTYPSVFMLLKEKSWIPSRYGITSSKCHRRCPNNVFLCNKEVVSLLGDHAWYAVPRLTNKKFLEAFGIETGVKFETLVQMFMKWVEKSQKEDEKAFVTSIEHIANVYKFMGRQIRDSFGKRKELEDVIKDKPVVFVPENDSHRQDPMQVVAGEFVVRKRVYWCDPSNLMQKPSLVPALSALTQPRRMLQNYYDLELCSFFVNFLEIDETPNLNEYVGLMEAIASQSTMASGPIVDDMMHVYNVVGTKCDPKTDHSSTNVEFIKRKLSSLKVFPTTEDKWVSLDEKPLFSDDKSLEKMFRGDDDEATKADDSDATIVQRTREKVHFVKMGLQRKLFKKQKDRNEEEEKQMKRITKNVRVFFAKVCGIRNLSECASPEIIPGLITESYHLQAFLHKWVPYIQRYLVYKEINHYGKQQDQGMIEKLGKVKSFGVTSLEVVYRLSTHPSVNISVKKNCAIDKRDMVFYVTDSNLSDTKDLITELARFFAPPNAVGGLNSFISCLSQQEDSEIENFMDKQDLNRLPKDVEIWNVPEPVLPEPVFVPMPEPLEELNPDPLPEVPNDRRQVTNEIDGEPRGLQSWPPKSSAILPNEAAGKNPTTEQILTMWPPPAPPEAYSMPARAENQPTADQKPKTTQEVQAPVNPDPRSFPPPSNHLFPNTVVSAHPEERPPSDKAPSNIETAAAEVHNVAPMIPMASPINANLSQRPHTRPLAVLNNAEVSVELEEIQLGSSIERTELICLASSANAEQVGRWGEDCVFKLMQKMAEVTTGFEAVTWVNESNESGLPYDIVIKEQTGDTTFIEVKSTSSAEKHVLEISSQEIQCAFKKKGRYHLYRVYNAGNPSAFRVSRLCNLAMNLDSKAVRLFMLI